MGVKEDILGKTPSDRADNKGLALSKVLIPEVEQSYGVRISVLSLEKIPGGVRAYVKGWDTKNNPLGFGPDGAVEIECINMYNPPILVPDGTSKMEEIEEGIFSPVLGFKEDLKQALIDSLTHTVSLVGKPGKNVVKGLVGNTVTVVNPLAGTGTAPIDGIIYRSVTSESFATIRAGAGTGNKETDGNSVFAYLAASTTTDEFAQLRRGGIGFPTSAVGGDTVSSAIISLYGASKLGQIGEPDCDIVSFSPADESNFANSDFAVANFGSTVFASKTYSAWATAYNDFTLNASGISHINGSGNTYFGVRLSWDVDNSFGGTWVSGQSMWFQIREVDYTGTAYDPKFTITHAGGGGGVTLQNRRAFRGISRGIMRGV